MKREITENIILDLLPLYLAGEVSDETRALVETYLEADPTLAAKVEEARMSETRSEIPVPLTQEDKLESFRLAKAQMRLQIALVAVGATILILALAGALVAFFLAP